MTYDVADVKHSWGELSADVLESIFAKLSEPYVSIAACACKRWYGIAVDFLLRLPKTSFFRVHDVRYSLTEKDGSYLFEKSEDSEDVSSPEPNAGTCFEGAGGIYYSFTARATVLYKLHILEQNFRETSSFITDSSTVIEEDNFTDIDGDYFAPCPLFEPVVGVLRKRSESGSRLHKIVFSGGFHYGFLYCNEDRDDCSVVMYDSQKDAWERCADLPVEFIPSTGTDEMNAVIHRGLFYAYNIRSGSVSELDTDTKKWSAVKWVLPPEVVDELVLVSLSDRLYVVGIQYREGTFCFRVWKVDEDTMEVGEMLCTTEIPSPEPRHRRSANDVRWESPSFFHL